MLYTLTLAGAAKLTGLGEFTILRMIEEGRIAGAKDLFGDWHVDEPELLALRVAPEESAPQKSLERGHAIDATHLGTETVTSDPVNDTNQVVQNFPGLASTAVLLSGYSLRDGQQYLLSGKVVGKQHASQMRSREAANPNTSVHSASTWIHEIRINDEDKTSDRVPRSGTWGLRTLLISGTLLLALGWIGGLSSYHFVNEGLPSPGLGISKQTVAPDKQATSVSGQRLLAENNGQVAATAKSNGFDHPRGRRMASKQTPDQDRETTQSIKQQDRLTRAPTHFPDTRPTTVSGWTLRAVVDGTAVLDGPHGTWKAVRGDVVPGLGRVDSIVLWGTRWIVATTQGLVTTP